MSSTTHKQKTFQLVILDFILSSDYDCFNFIMSTCFVEPIHLCVQNYLGKSNLEEHRNFSTNASGHYFSVKLVAILVVSCFLFF